MRRATPEDLSEHDAAVWHAVDILQKLERGAAGQVPNLSAMFPPQLAQGERFLAQAPFRLLSFTAGGDGSYLHSGSAPFVAAGRGAMLGATLAASGVMAIGNAAGNARRRAEADRAAQQQWRQIDHGHLYVSTHGFYMHTPHALNTWTFASMTAAEIISPGCMLMTGNSRNGPVQWVINSIQAELLFTQWARQVHPRHPQLTSHAWLPAGWIERVQESPYELPSFGASQVEGR